MLDGEDRHLEKLKDAQEALVEWSSDMDGGGDEVPEASPASSAEAIVAWSAPVPSSPATPPPRTPGWFIRLLEGEAATVEPRVDAADISLLAAVAAEPPLSAAARGITAQFSQGSKKGTPAKSTQRAPKVVPGKTRKNMSARRWRSGPCKKV